MDSGDLVHGRTNPTHKRRKQVKINTSVDETNVEAVPFVEEKEVDKNITSFPGGDIINDSDTEYTTLDNNTPGTPEQKNNTAHRDSSMVVSEGYEEDDISKTIVLGGSLFLLLLCVGKVLR